MQELFFPYITVDVDSEFDGFECMANRAYPNWNNHAEQWQAAVMFVKTNSNGKKIYLVADREVTIGPTITVHCYNVLEFKHSLQRAQREYQERLGE